MKNSAALDQAMVGHPASLTVFYLYVAKLEILYG